MQPLGQTSHRDRKLTAIVGAHMGSTKEWAHQQPGTNGVGTGGGGSPSSLIRLLW